MKEDLKKINYRNTCHDLIVLLDSILPTVENLLRKSGKKTHRQKFILGVSNQVREMKYSLKKINESESERYLELYERMIEIIDRKKNDPSNIFGKEKNEGIEVLLEVLEELSRDERAEKLAIMFKENF